MGVRWACGSGCSPGPDRCPPPPSPGTSWSHGANIAAVNSDGTCLWTWLSPTPWRRAAEGGDRPPRWAWGGAARCQARTPRVSVWPGPF